MMNPHKVKQIITGTLDKIPATYQYTDVDILLVGLTLMNETKLDQDPVSDPLYVGMCGIEKENLKWFVSDFLRSDLAYNDIIFNATGVDLNEVHGDALYWAMETNLSFMIAVTYLWYTIKAHRPMTAEEAIELYQKAWLGQGRKENATKAMTEFNRLSRRA